MKKLQLTEIKVKSFVTVIDEEEKIKGGYSVHDCSPDFTDPVNCTNPMVNLLDTSQNGTRQ